MKLSRHRAITMVATGPAVAFLALHLNGGGSLTATAFAPQYSHTRIAQWKQNSPLGAPSSWALCMSDQPPDEEGADLASQFFKAVSDRNMSFEGDEIDFADAEDEEMESAEGEDVELDDDDDAILREYDVSSEGSLTDEQIYDEVKERVFESAGAFVELTKGAEEGEGQEGPKVYTPPTNVPDSGLNAGEVVELVLSALRNNDMPSPDYGVEVFFGYSSSESQIVEQIESEGLTAGQYKSFLAMSEDNFALFQHSEALIDKADFSPDRLKGYFTARLISEEPSIEDVSVNFILSTSGTDDDDCWLIDSMLIRPSKLRRRRRR